MEAIAARLRIKAASPEQEVLSLSGGNQQKVVIGKWLLSRPRVLLCDEPTRGVDIGAKMEIYRRLRELANEGLGIVMVSSELPEILGVCDRLLVMRSGKITAELTHGEATEEKVMAAAIGGKDARTEGARGLRRPRILGARTDLIVYVTLVLLFLGRCGLLPVVPGSLQSHQQPEGRGRPWDRWHRAGHGDDLGRCGPVGEFYDNANDHHLRRRDGRT